MGFHRRLFFGFDVFFSPFPPAKIVFLRYSRCQIPGGRQPSRPAILPEGDGRYAILDEHEVARAVGAIGERLSETAWGRGGWDDVCKSLAQALPGSVSLIRNVDLTRQTLNSMFAEGVDPDLLVAYREHFAALDPWVAYAGGVPEGQVRVTERDCPSSAFHDTAFYTDWLSGQDNLKAATGIRIDVDADNTVIVCWHYPVEQAPACDGLAAAVLEGVKPSLVDAVRSAAMLRHGLERTRRLGPLVERIDGAAVLVDSRRRVREANAEASAAIAQGEVMGVKCGSLMLCDPAAQRWFDETATHMLAGRRPDATTTAFVAGEHVFRVSVTLAPYGEEASLLVGPRPQLLVVLRPLTGMAVRLDAGALHLAFGLSGAETRLCEILANGRSLAEAAAVLRISEGTVRQRAKAAFHKTGTHRQGQLIALVSRFAADR